MPHLTVEYSNNLTALDCKVLLSTLNTALVATGHFEEADIKSRAIRLDDYVIGTDASIQRAFVHAKLALLDGRSAEVKNTLSHSLLKILKNWSYSPAGLQMQLCVEIIDMDRASYVKHSFTS